MHDDIEYRVMLAHALREAGASFDVIVEVLKARTRIAQQREKLRSSPRQLRELQIAQHRNAGYQPLGTIPVSPHARIQSTARKAKRGAVPAWLYGLDMRIANALLRAGFQSAEEVRDAITQGKVIESIKARRISVIEAWLQAAR